MIIATNMHLTQLQRLTLYALRGIENRQRSKHSSSRSSHSTKISGTKRQQNIPTSNRNMNHHYKHRYTHIQENILLL